MGMKISVVIPTLNGGVRFREVLMRVLGQTCSFPMEVLCVDSGSTGGTAGFAKEQGVRVISIPKERFNHGDTRNLGIRETEGELVALLVQDALPADEHWMEHLARALLSVEDAAGSYARQVPREGCDPILRERLLHWAAGRPERSIQRLPPGVRFEELDPWKRLELCAFDNVSSMVRRTVWERHPFPTASFGEDVAWGARVIPAGHALVYEPEAAVIHSHNNSVWYEFKRIYADHRNLNRLFGLTTVPKLGMIWRNGRGALAHYRALIRAAEPPGSRRMRLLLRAVPYAFLENLAQYLGARLWRSVEAGGHMAAFLDQRLRRGV